MLDRIKKYTVNISKVLNGHVIVRADNAKDAKKTAEKVVGGNQKIDWKEGNVSYTAKVIEEFGE